MGVKLRHEESFSQDLEERFLRRKSDIVLTLRAIETKPTALAARQDYHSNLTLTNQIVTRCSMHRFFVRGHFNLREALLLLNCIKSVIILCADRRRGFSLRVSH